MLVNEIIQRVRHDLDDHGTVSYTELDILSRIRSELNDTAVNGNPVNVLQEARKILGDESSRPVANRANVTLDGIRAKLGDVSDSVLGVTTEANVNADSVIHYAQWGNTGGVIGTTGNINASVQLAASSNLIPSYVEDGIKTIKGMRPDALINEQLSGGFQAALNLYVLARCLEGEVETGTNGYSVFYDRFTAAVAAVPPHVPDAVITHYIQMGEDAVNGHRPDIGICDATVSLLEDFVMAQVSQSKLGDNSKHQFNLTNFYNELDKIPYHWTDAELNNFISDGGNVILSKRPDLNNTTAKSILELDYTVFNALERRIGKDANAATVHQVHHDHFYSELENLPRHWTDEELADFQKESVQILASLRDDLTDGLKVRSDLVPAVLFCISSIANNYKKDSGSRNLSDTQWTKLLGLIKALPYHWTDDILMDHLHDSIRDILRLRNDARMDDFGYELSGIETEPLITDEFPLRESFAKASEWFSAAGAISCRIGTDSGADAKYQLWIGRYQNEIKGR